MLPLKQLVNNEGQIADVPANPRLIKDDKYKALVKSLQEDDLTGVEPLKVYPMGEQYVVLGGNMRFRALQELKAQDVACIIVPKGTPAKVLRKIVAIDNSQFGEYDWDLLANEWGVDAGNWGDDINSLLDNADFESLKERAREAAGKEQFTFIFDSTDALIVSAYIKEHGKQELTAKILEICLNAEAK